MCFVPLDPIYSLNVLNILKRRLGTEDLIFEVKLKRSINEHQ